MFRRRGAVDFVTVSKWVSRAHYFASCQTSGKARWSVISEVFSIVLRIPNPELHHEIIHNGRSLPADSECISQHGTDANYLATLEATLRTHKSKAFAKSKIGQTRPPAPPSALLAHSSNTRAY